jgi:hypothetical protein
MEPSDAAERFPDPARQPLQRAADADRDQTVTLLREHVVVGRLTLDEFSERVGGALAARTRGELDALVADLPARPQPEPEATRRQIRRWIVAVMSGATAKGRWRVGDHTTAIAVMGGCVLDLRQAQISGSEVVINAFAIMGGIDIIVPEGIDVELAGFAMMGGRHMRIRDVPIIPGSPRIIIRAFPIMGAGTLTAGPSTAARGRRHWTRFTTTAPNRSSLTVITGIGRPTAGPGGTIVARHRLRRIHRRHPATAPSPFSSATWSTTRGSPSGWATGPPWRWCPSTTGSFAPSWSVTAAGR